LLIASTFLLAALSFRLQYPLRSGNSES